MRTILSNRSDISLAPEVVDLLARAFSDCLTALGPAGQTADAREVLSGAMIAEALKGERDPIRLCEAATRAFRERSRH
jgi:hypothetical protein